MRRRASVLMVSTAAAMAVVVIGASAAAGSGHPAKQVNLMAAGPQAGLPDALPDRFTELENRAKRATVEAEKRGADISFTMLDRQTGRIIDSGDRAPFPIASVSKLFIADDLLMRLAQKNAKLSPKDRKGLETMLRSSDDYPADEFWARGGGDAIIKRVAARYQLTKTTTPYNGDWWNTMSTTTDIVRYYGMLLDGAGGLPPEGVEIMLSNLSASTPRGVDGYPQRFGIPDGLFAEPVAVKQGWMCCWGPANQVHLSTGVVGPDRRYAIAVASMQPTDEAAARNTLTQVIKTMFPGGRI